jgi:hypothetical protein
MEWPNDSSTSPSSMESSSPSGHKSVDSTKGALEPEDSKKLEFYSKLIY